MAYLLRQLLSVPILPVTMVVFVALCIAREADAGWRMPPRFLPGLRPWTPAD